METLTPQFSFQDGELLISTPTRSFRICGWPVPHAHERLGNGPWKNWRPEFRLVKPQPEVATTALDAILSDEADDGPDSVARRNARHQKRVAFEVFRSQLPEGVARHIERFYSHQWNMLDLLSKGLIDLLHRLRRHKAAKIVKPLPCMKKEDFLRGFARRMPADPLCPGRGLLLDLLDGNRLARPIGEAEPLGNGQEETGSVA